MTAARTTTVTNTLQNPGTGSPLVGKNVSIRLNTPGFIDAGSTEKIRTTTVATDATGTWTATLEVNDDIDPAGTYYTVAEYPGIIWTFVVPYSASPLSLRACLVDNPPNPTPMAAGVPLPDVDVPDGYVWVTDGEGGGAYAPETGGGGAVASVNGHTGTVVLGAADVGAIAVGDAAPLAQAGQGPSQAPVAPGTSNVGSLDVSARADHVHPSASAYGWLGSGAHGDLTFDGTTSLTLNMGIPNWDPKTLTPTSNVYTLMCDIYATNLTVNSGVTINAAGWRIFVNGVLTNNGTIRNNGAGATSFAGAAGGGGQSLLAGMAGGDASTGVGTAGASANYVISQGGAGGSGSSGAGGGGGQALIGNDNVAASQLHTFPVRTVGRLVGSGWGASPYPGASGGGGGGDGTNSGGGGGGGGGFVLVNTNKLAGSGAFAANGGNGFAPTAGNCGGGGAAGGGLVFVNAVDISGWTGTATALAGTPGAGKGTGTAGGTALAGWAVVTAWK